MKVGHLMGFRWPWFYFICKEHAKIHLDIVETLDNVPPSQMTHGNEGLAKCK